MLPWITPLFSRWSRFKSMRIILMFPYFVTATLPHTNTPMLSPRFVNYFYHFIFSLWPLSFNPQGWLLRVLLTSSMALKPPVWQISGHTNPKQRREHFFKHIYLFIPISCSSSLWDSYCFSLKSKILEKHSRYIMTQFLSAFSTTTPSNTHTDLLLAL